MTILQHGESTPTSRGIAIIRCHLRQLLGEDDIGGLASQIVITSLCALIIMNVLAVMLSTVPDIYNHYGHTLHTIEVISVAVFSVEYLLRIWAIGKFRAILSPYMVIDLLAILPFYLPLLIPIDLRFLRILRLSRIFRILKMARYSQAIQLLARVLKTKIPELIAVSALLAIVLVLISSFVFFAEHTAQPDKFSSIPDTLWWGIVTMTTIGYGDTFPITPIGKALAAMLALLGIGLFALPAGIISSGFIEEIQHSKKKREATCPHCGHQLEKN